MALVVRIDVDRPYGKRPLPRHMLSRLSSDYYFPKVEAFGYLRELKEVLCMLNDANAHAYLFFRRCTLPSDSVIKLIDKGKARDWAPSRRLSFARDFRGRKA